MNIIIRWSGIDAAQFRALVHTYLVMDLRKGGGARRAGEANRHSVAASPYTALVVASLVNSIAAGLLVFVIRDVLTAAVAMITLAAMNTAMLVMIDFASFVVATEDYWIIAPRPVSSRTYFAARIAAVLLYISLGATIIAAFPSVIFMLRHGVGLTGGLAAIFANVIACVATAGAVIGAYTTLIARVHPRRVARAMTLLQVVSSGVSLAVFYIAVEATEQTAIRQVSIRDVEWVWALPPAWFAAIVSVASGGANAAEWIASAGALAFTCAALVIASGRVSLELAENLAEATAAGEPPIRRASVRIPAFRQGESYAIATLIRAQFRYDTKFRLAVLSVLPLTAFYLMLGLEEGALKDPFTSGEPGSAPIYIAISFLPLTLHASIRYSDHWRAAWIFFASPADPARLALAAKNFVAIFFLGTYTAALATVWAFWYERVWHAVVHAAIVGAGAHMVLQAAVLFGPALPFATEPRRMEQGGRVMLLFFCASVGAGIAPVLLPYVYADAVSTVVLVTSLAGATIGLEMVVRHRVREVMTEVEFS